MDPDFTTMKHRSGLLASGSRKVVGLERELITEDRRPYMYEYYASFIVRRRVSP